MSLMIGNNSVVAIHYTLTNNSGEVLDSSEGSDPLRYLHGAGNIIPGLEQALTGKTTGATMQVNVAPAEAYGETQPELIQIVPVEAFQGVETVEPGMTFEAQDQQGNSRPITVRSVEGDQVTIDANHPLAGVELNFDVEIVEVRDASAEEIEHGHVH